MSRSTIKYYLVIFLSLLLTNFFGASKINNAILLGLMIPFVILEFSKKSVFKWYFVAVFIGLFVSIFSCYYYRDQSIAHTFKASSPYFYIFFYFVLKYFDLSMPKMEKALFILIVIFCVSYIFQFIVYPKVIFSGAEVVYGEDVRIRMAGQGLSSLGYFLGLNKFLRDKKNIFHLLLSILCFGVIFLMAFRIVFVMIAFFTLVLIIRIKGFTWKLAGYGLIICVVFVAFLQIPIFESKIESMLGRQETQVLSNKDYIRVVQFKYFMQYHFRSVWEYIWGSGMTYDTKQESSVYGRYMLELPRLGIFWDDWGLLGLSWMIGIVAVVSMVAYSIKAFLIKLSSGFHYLGIWFIYLVIVSTTMMEFYLFGNFIVQSIVLYMIEKKFFQQKSILANSGLGTKV